MNKKVLKLLLLPWLILPSVSCGNDDGDGEFKKVSHNDFALRAIKGINATDNFSKGYINGTCEVYSSGEIISINNASFKVKEKEIDLQYDNRNEDYRGIAGIIENDFNPYYYICELKEDGEAYTNCSYYLNDDFFKIEYDNNFESCQKKDHCVLTYHDIITWNNYGMLNYFEHACSTYSSFNAIVYVLKLNFTYE